MAHTVQSPLALLSNISPSVWWRRWVAKRSWATASWDRARDVFMSHWNHTGNGEKNKRMEGGCGTYEREGILRQK